MNKKLATLAIGGIIVAGAAGVGVGRNNPHIPPKNPHFAYINDTLTTMTASEKATAKGVEIKRVASSTVKTNVKFSGGDYDIKIDHINTIDKGVEVFAQVWNPNGTQIGFGEDGTVDIERFVIINPPILVDDPNGDIYRLISATSTVVATSTGATTTIPATYRRLREDPKQAILDSIAHTVSIKKQKFDASKIVKGKVGNTTTTVYPAAGANSPVDGRVEHYGSVWSTVRSATTGSQAQPSTASTIILQGEFYGGSTYDISRPVFSFDTSAIGSDTISNAVFSVYSQTTSDQSETTYPADATVVSATTNSTDNLITSDYNILNYGTTEFASRITLADFVSSSKYNDFTLNASGIAYINTSGVTQLAIRPANDLDNNTPTARSYGFGYYADQTGTANDPKLVIEHAAAASAQVFHPHEF